MSDFRIETVDEFLERQGMRVAAFARALGVHRVTLSQYIKSKKDSHLVRTNGDSIELVRCERIMGTTDTATLNGEKKCAKPT